jgi:hypothetical protein
MAGQPQPAEALWESAEAAQERRHGHACNSCEGIVDGNIKPTHSGPIEARFADAHHKAGPRVEAQLEKGVCGLRSNPGKSRQRRSHVLHHRVNGGLAIGIRACRAPQHHKAIFYNRKQRGRNVP